MNFTQEPPELKNQFDNDPVLKRYLNRKLSSSNYEEVLPELKELGELVAGELLELMQKDRTNEPKLIRWSAWGERIDEIRRTKVWERAEEVAVDHGLVADAYDRPIGPESRIAQMAKVYLFGPSTDTYSCPLAMTDGAARTLLHHDNTELVDRAVPRLTSRDLEQFWTSGQWMTETTGGSDVGRSNTEARKENGSWKLYGRKWFTSAASADMALTLARPEGNEEGGSGLALFYVETRDDDGRLQNIKINRLKEKLGTKELPTAELTLDGTPATPVNGLKDGVKNISPMLNITRTWNAVNAVASMRRGLALAKDYSEKRKAFGDKLSEKPLHVDTLAGLQAEYEGAFQLTFRITELLGQHESGSISEKDRNLLRSLTPIVKLLTGKQAVRVASEIIECFGGAGYVEDTGLPKLLRDSQVLPIWEGTTNVLSLDFLRTLKDPSRIEAMGDELERIKGTLDNDELNSVCGDIIDVYEEGVEWLETTFKEDPENLEASARRFAKTIGRAFELALLCEQAQWDLEHDGDKGSLSAVRRYEQHGVDRLLDVDPSDSYRMINERS